MIRVWLWSSWDDVRVALMRIKPRCSRLSPSYVWGEDDEDCLSVSEYIERWLA